MESIVSSSLTSSLTSAVSSSPDKLLALFESLPDLRLEQAKKAEQKPKEENGVVVADSTPNTAIQDDYLRRKVSFVVSNTTSMVTTCDICKQDFAPLEYDFYKEGVKLNNVSLNGVALHKIREHSENFPADVKEFLQQHEWQQKHGQLGKSLGKREYPFGVQAANRRPRVIVNRANVSPTLIRIFLKNNESHKEEEFSGKNTPEREINLHLWVDATLREITDLLKETQPVAREWGSRLNYSLVYPDKRGKNVLKEIGSVDAHRFGRDDNRTLDELHYQMGDFLAISLQSPKLHDDKQQDTATEETADKATA